MTSPSKRKGNRFESELVTIAKLFGVEAAERARGSDGRALGEDSEVDLMVAGQRVQAKRRARIASYLAVPQGCDAVAFRQDRGPTMVLMTYPDWLKLVDQTQRR